MGAIVAASVRSFTASEVGSGMTCPRCQQDNPPAARFCNACGARLDAALWLTTRFGSPESYTPAHLAQKILTSKAVLEGERKQITVLFADLKSSMELLADRDPEDSRALLDPVLELMMEAVHRYEGTVNQIMGDGIMALFGAPVAHEDHGVRACYAALRMREWLSRYADDTRRREGVTLQMRVGLNSGEVVVRSIGNDLHMDYSAVGPTTHLAARMEQLAAPGTILVTSDTLRLVEGYVDAKSLGLVNVKGLSAPIEVHEVLGLGVLRSRFEAAVARGLTRFVGRDHEMERLGQVLEQARGGCGQVVALVGEPGVGKSRLVLEFTRSEGVFGWRVLETDAAPYGKSTPYMPVVNLLHAYFKIERTNDQREIRRRVTDQLAVLDLPPGADASALLALLDVAVEEDPQWAALDPPGRRQRTLDAVRRLFLHESRRQPLLLVFEDVQWIDSETAAVLNSLVTSLPAARTVLLVTYRPEYRHDWAGQTSYSELRIDPLSPERAEELLGALLGEDPGLRSLKHLLLARTAGNPFFLEESVRTLVETRTLRGERGAYSLERPLEAIRVPSTVEAVLGARIDRLPAKEKRLLQSAAAIGADVPRDLLAAIADQDPGELRQGLAHLQAAEFLYETGSLHEPHYMFKHALTHEVAYGALLSEQRRGLHARIVRAIEHLYQGRVTEQVDRLAHHALRGELWPEAVGFLRQAGLRAVSRSASREAVTHFEQALATLRHLPETRQTLELAFDLRFELQGAYGPLGELERMLACLREAERIAGTIGDQRRLGLVCASMTHCLWWSGDPDRAVESGKRSLGIAVALGDSELEMVTNIRLGQAYFALGEYTLVVEACRACLHSLKGDLLHQGSGLSAIPAVISLAFMGRSFALLGDFRNGLATTDEAIRVAELSAHPYSMVLAYWASGDVYLTRGDLPRAEAALERSQALCAGQGFTLMAPILARALGEAYALAGRHAEALALLQGAVDELAAMKYVPALPSAYGALSEGLLLAGELAKAFQAAACALDLCRQHHQRGNAAYVLGILSAIHAAKDPPDFAAAEAAYQEALALAAEIGNRPLVARCELGLGKLNRKSGERLGAEAHLVTAVAELRALDMPLWLDEAQSELDALRGAHHT